MECSARTKCAQAAWQIGLEVATGRTLWCRSALPETSDSDGEEAAWNRRNWQGGHAPAPRPIWSSPRSYLNYDFDVGDGPITIDGHGWKTQAQRVPGVKF